MYALGVDVSHWNGIGDWKQARSQGVSYAFIRAGSCNANTGISYVDDLLMHHISGTKAAGLPSMLYWYLRCRWSVDVQMKFFVDVAKANPGCRLVLDIEAVEGLTRLTQTKAILAAVNNLKDATGKLPIIYTRQSIFDGFTDANAVIASCPLWAARWSSNLNSPWSDGRYKFRDWNAWKFWQFSGDNNAKASMYGFNSGDPDLDLNWYNGTQAELYEWLELAQAPPMSIEDRVKRLEELHGL